MSGAQLAARIRQEYPLIIVVVTSGYFNDEKWSGPVVAKPYNLFETANALAERARDSRRKEGDL
jgi:UDP-N-acetyl-D-mannosaminuronic acid transferase (WecB/TagA/CpsF family)